jgi:hypothetical protein
MIIRRFVREDDREYGVRGFRPLWIENANAFEGYGCAHDVLEHARNEPGPAEGECMAMGACVYVRALPGWWAEQWPNNVNPPEVHIASTIVDIMREVRYGTQRLPLPVTRRMRDDDVESAFDAILHEGCKIWQGEAVDGGEETPLTSAELDAILAWMRIGYRRASRRYGAIGGNGASYLFTQVAKAIDAELRRAGEGMELTVRVNVPRCEVRTELRYPGDSAEF